MLPETFNLYSIFYWLRWFTPIGNLCLERRWRLSELYEEEIIKRNEFVNAIQKQVEIIKNNKQNITGLLLNRSQILQQTRAEQNHIAIEQLKFKARKLEN